MSVENEKNNITSDLILTFDIWQVKPKLKAVRRAYDEALLAFGSTSVGKFHGNLQISSQLKSFVDWQMSRFRFLPFSYGMTWQRMLKTGATH